MNARYDSNQAFAESCGVQGDDFWRSIWKRIEVSKPPDAQATRRGEVVLQAPRDYVVAGERRSIAR